MKKFSFLLFLATLTACQTKSQEVDFNETFALEKSHKEVSGMVFHKSTNKLWMLQDKGNPAELYAYTTKGTFVKTLKIINQENTDWEDLSQDKNGNLYIGNFGNNDNKRQDLRILKIDGTKLNESVTEASQTTTFTYEDQKDFPPKKSNLLYDCEAFVTTANYFYLFTKNRSKGFDGTFYVYKIPNKPGDFVAKKVATLKSCEQYKKCAITGAALNKNENKIALLTHDKVLLISFVNDASFKQGNIAIKDLGHNSQKEALTFLDDETLLIADEKEKGTNGGKVYTLRLH